jgi:hypothetical protein
MRRQLYWDHRHWRDSVYVYEFVSAGQLLEDFLAVRNKWKLVCLDSFR